MAGKIKVNTSRLNSDSNQISECIRAIKSEMGKMEASAGQLDSMWDGESSETFKSVFKEDRDLLAAVIISLEKIQKDEMDAKSKYYSCENKVSSLVSAIRV